MASQDEEKKRKRETRTPTMTRRKLSMKSFISGISVDDTLSSFLHGFKVFSFSLSLSFSLFLLLVPNTASHARAIHIISFGCRGDVAPLTYPSYGAFTRKFPRHRRRAIARRMRNQPRRYTLILNNDTLATRSFAALDGETPDDAPRYVTRATSPSRDASTLSRCEKFSSGLSR